MFELSSNFLFEPFEFLEKFEPGSNVFFEPVRTFGRFEPLWFEPPRGSNQAGSNRPKIRTGSKKKVRTWVDEFERQH
jgi:hypothetical protein